MHRTGTTLANIAVTGHNYHLARDHHVSGTFNTISKRLTTPVQVVKLRFCNRVVNIKCREEEFALLQHLVEAVNTGCSLLRNTLNRRGGFMPATLIGSKNLFQNLI